jgi:origin recognition complex subunit 1
MARINFQPYSREQLERIVEARLASAKEEMDEDKKPSQVVIAPDAIKLAAMTVSRITGDARRVLDICRFVFYYFCSLYISYIFPAP